MTRPPHDNQLPHSQPTDYPMEPAHRSPAGEPPGQGSERSFGVVFALVFGIVALWPLQSGGDIRFWALLVAVAFALAAAMKPTLLRRPSLLWGKFGRLLHRIVSPIVLFFLFAAVITPIALILRAGGKDPLDLKLRPEQPSYWVTREPPGPPPDSLRNQF